VIYLGSVVSKKEVITQLAGSLSAVAGRPLLLHLDISKIGILDGLQERERMLSDYTDLISEAARPRTVLIPTFNYDFCQTGLFDVSNDECQVGTLNEHLRRSGLPRTQTPVFSFCLMNNRAFGLFPVQNPFGRHSTFQILCELDGWIGFLGAGFNANTFLHFVEEGLPISYRYIKVFRGVVKTPGQDRPVELHYRVRPPMAGAVDYDWDRLEGVLSERKILESHRVGRGRLRIFSCRRLSQFWHERLMDDELYFLSPHSRNTVQSLFAKHGRPLTFERVEGTIQ
jgi:aminoglycoside N3'-acetyltransferase